MNKSELIEAIASSADIPGGASLPVKTKPVRKRAVAKPAAKKRARKKK